LLAAPAASRTGPCRSSSTTARLASRDGGVECPHRIGPLDEQHLALRAEGDEVDLDLVQLLGDGLATDRQIVLVVLEADRDDLVLLLELDQGQLGR
jgi:hypothetical protein